MAGLGLTGFIAASGQDLSYIFQKWDGVTPVAQETKYLTTLSGALATSKDLNQIFQPGTSIPLIPLIPFINVSDLSYTFFYNATKTIIMITAGSGTISFNTAVSGATISLIGGGGGGSHGSTSIRYGGGSGGYCNKIFNLTQSISYSVSIGTGGIGGTASSVTGGSGGNTIFNSSLTAYGGGGGGNSAGAGGSASTGTGITFQIGSNGWASPDSTNMTGGIGGTSNFTKFLFGNSTGGSHGFNTATSSIKGGPDCYGGGGYGGGGGGGSGNLNSRGSGDGGKGASGVCIIEIAALQKTNMVLYNNIDLCNVFQGSNTNKNHPFSITTNPTTIPYAINYSNQKYSIYLNNEQTFFNPESSNSGSVNIKFTQNIVNARVMLIGGGGKGHRTYNGSHASTANNSVNGGGGGETVFFSTNFTANQEYTFTIGGAATNTTFSTGNTTYNTANAGNSASYDLSGKGGGVTGGTAVSRTSVVVGKNGTLTTSGNITIIGGGSGAASDNSLNNNGLGGGCYGYEWVNLSIPSTITSGVSYGGQLRDSQNPQGGASPFIHGRFGGGGSPRDIYLDKAGCGYVGITFAYP